MKNIFGSLSPRIAVFAPSGPIDRTKTAATLELWHDNGAKVKIMPHAFAGSAPESYLAATVVERVDDFHAAWFDDEIDWLIPTRGGYGSAQMLGYLNYAAMRRSDKKVFGYSDLTALHLALTASGCGTPISAPMTGRFAELTADRINRESFQKALGVIGGEWNIGFSGATYTPGEASGLPMVLNVTVGASLCGTPFMPDPQGRIIVLEDVNEPVYRIDRALNQLMSAGVFDGAAGVLFGDFINCGDRGELEIVFQRLAASADFPAADGFPFGHGSRLVSLNWKNQVRFSTRLGKTDFTVI